MELVQTLVNGFLSTTNVTRSFALEVAKALDPTLKIHMETICVLNLILKFVYKSYLLLNQIYIKYCKS